MKVVTKKMVEFFYPGSLFAENETKERTTDDVNDIKVPKNVFGFKTFELVEKSTEEDGERFTKTARQSESGMYYPDGQVYTLQNIKDYFPDHHILISNMKSNKYSKVVKTRLGNFQPFNKGDCII